MHAATRSSNRSSRAAETEIERKSILAGGEDQPLGCNLVATESVLPCPLAFAVDRSGRWRPRLPGFPSPSELDRTCHCLAGSVGVRGSSPSVPPGMPGFTALLTDPWSGRLWKTPTTSPNGSGTSWPGSLKTGRWRPRSGQPRRGPGLRPPRPAGGRGEHGHGLVAQRDYLFQPLPHRGGTLQLMLLVGLPPPRLAQLGEHLVQGAPRGVAGGLPRRPGGGVRGAEPDPLGGVTPLRTLLLCKERQQRSVYLVGVGRGDVVGAAFYRDELEIRVGMPCRPANTGHLARPCFVRPPHKVDPIWSPRNGVKVSTADGSGGRSV